MHPTRLQAAIIEAVRNEGAVRIAALARRLAVSDETIRRQVKPLVADGLLTRTHGGIAWAAARSEPPFHRRLAERAAAKRMIGELAAERVQDGQTVMIDTGSTTAYTAEALSRRRRDLTVITNSLEIARRLVGRNGNRVFLAGGELRADLAAAVGPEAVAFLDQFRADLAILSIAAIDPEAGLMDFDLDEARIARTMLTHARARLVVADTSKFGRRAPVWVCAAGEIGTVVTEAPPPAELAARLSEAGVELLWPAG
ncbi:DeoR/GlpR family DNA-binding transcription regulator [Benzoatithermus flavus]|uniref:DeoR/GlpR family DNA-binding transcription regulator n=1 Tax=Benzoatithermus flavus TaxID=3108223 RepID=A0ABU8XX22_9PROT